MEWFFIIYGCRNIFFSLNALTKHLYHFQNYIIMNIAPKMIHSHLQYEEQLRIDLNYLNKFLQFYESCTWLAQSLSLVFSEAYGLIPLNFVYILLIPLIPEGTPPPQGGVSMSLMTPLKKTKKPIFFACGGLNWSL